MLTPSAALGFSATVWRHAVPEEGVIPCLRGVVKNPGVGSFMSGLDDSFQRFTFVTRTGDRGIQFVDVGLVVLAVVKAQRFGRNVRLERICGVRKFGKFD